MEDVTLRKVLRAAFPRYQIDSGWRLPSPIVPQEV
jgi:hypothetical protein